MDYDAHKTDKVTLLGELLGTFVFVLVVAGAVCVDQTSAHSIGRLGMALAGGFALSAMMYALAMRSRPDLNPAVTLTRMLVGRATPAELCRRWLAQLIGAAVAGMFLRVIFPGALASGLGSPTVETGDSFMRAVGIEGLVGFAWVFTLGATVWRESRPHTGPIAVGLVYATAVLLLGPLTGAAGNPARAFGPAFAAGVYSNQHIYWIGPFLGALLAVPVLKVFLVRQPREPEVIEPIEIDDALASYQEGVCLFREGQLEEAAHFFALATEKRPHWPEPYYYIGMVYRDLGDEENANAFFDAALHFRFQLLQRAGRQAWR